MLQRTNTILGILFLTCSTTVWGDEVSKVNVVDCPKTLEKEALDVASTLRDWDTLYAAYMRFLPCDDGAIAEGFTESVVRILVEHWASLGRLSKFAKKDPSFLRFIYRHITSSADPEDLKQILNNLKKHGCPTADCEVCREVELAVTRALEEM
jgi:hypothetical protein